MSDQLSDYGFASRHSSAHVCGVTTRSTVPACGAPILLHTEEVTGSNPVSPTGKHASQTPIQIEEPALRAGYKQNCASGAHLARTNPSDRCSHQRGLNQNRG
jgi:hypothetical protein